MKNRLHFKYNSGNFAIVCGHCGKILKVGFEFSEEEMKACKGQLNLPNRFCEECELKLNKRNDREQDNIQDSNT